jgi:hypothetical protein
MNVWIQEDSATASSLPEQMEGGYKTYSFETDSLDGFSLYSTDANKPFAVKNGTLVADPSTAQKAIEKELSNLDNCEVTVDITPNQDGATINGGIYLRASGAKNAGDTISAYNIQLESASDSPNLTVNVFKFNSNSGYMGPMKKESGSDACSTISNYFSNGITKETVHLRAVIQGSTITVYIGDSNSPILTVNTATEYTVGAVGLRSQYSDIHFDNFTVISSSIPTDADKLVAEINKLPDTVTLNDKNTVDSLNGTYKALSDKLKAKVTNYSKLKAAVDIIAQLTESADAVNAVVAQIGALPEAITLSDKAAVEAARAAYNKLTDAEKASITNYGVLTAAENQIAQIGNTSQPANGESSTGGNGVNPGTGEKTWPCLFAFLLSTVAGAFIFRRRLSGASA